MRQIESKNISDIKNVLLGNVINNQNYHCDDTLIIKFNELYSFLSKEKILKSDQFSNLIGVNENNKYWEGLLLEILNVKIYCFKYIDENVLITSSVDSKLLSKEIKNVFDILKKNVVGMSIDDIIIESKKYRRKFNQEYVTDALKCLDLEVFESDFGELYATKIKSYFSAGEIAYRILWEEKRPLENSEIFSLINQRLKINGCAGKELRNITNQMTTRKEIINIGLKKWALKQWGHDKKYIRSTIRNVLLTHGKPLSKKEIVLSVLNEASYIKKSSVMSYLSTSDFLVLIDDRIILPEWKSGFSSLLSKRKVKQNFDKLLLDTFKVHKKDRLSSNEIWSTIKVNFSGKKSYLKNYLIRRKYLYHEDIDNIDYWTLKDEYYITVQNTKGNKLISIKKLAETIINENKGNCELSVLVKKLVDEYNFNSRSVYRVLSYSPFVKIEISKNKYIVKITGSQSSINLSNISETQFLDYLKSIKSEEATFDFKQGFLDLSKERKFDENSFEKIMKNVCAMANHGFGITGRLFIGITDKEQDTERIEKFDNIKVHKINEFGVVGIEREAKILNYSLEKFQNFILSRIFNSKIPVKLKNHLKSNISFIHFKGVYVLMFELNCIDGPSIYDDKQIYIRNGPNLELISNESPEIHQIYSRCFRTNT